jgi:hypothetical protein
MATRKKKTSMTESADIAEMEDKLLATDAKLCRTEELAPSAKAIKRSSRVHFCVNYS